MTSRYRGTVRRLLRAGSIAVLSVAAGACDNGTTTEAQSRTTLYVFAIYANPSLTVTVNGQTLGQITRQYTGSTQCTTLVQKTSADGVLVVPVTLGTRYSISWTYANGASDVDAFDATADVVEFECLIEPIPASTTTVAP